MNDEGHRAMFTIFRGHVAPLRAVLDTVDDVKERGAQITPDGERWYRLTCEILSNYAPVEKW